MFIPQNKKLPGRKRCRYRSSFHNGESQWVIFKLIAASFAQGGYETKLLSAPPSYA
jgi:hypothetical protein